MPQWVTVSVFLPKYIHSMWRVCVHTSVENRGWDTHGKYDGTLPDPPKTSPTLPPRYLNQ